MANWKPPEWADEALKDDGSSFLNEKKRVTGRDSPVPSTPTKKKKKKKGSKTPTTPSTPKSFPKFFPPTEPDSEPEPEPAAPATPEPVQITYQDWLLSMLKTLDINTLDTNGNGMVELNEFQAYFKEINPDLAETIFYDIDSDKDKYVTTIEYQEWKEKLDMEYLQSLRDNYQKYPEEKEPSPEPEPTPEPPKPVKRVVYKKPVDQSSLIAVLKTLDYKSLGGNGRMHWIDFNNEVSKHIDISTDELEKVFSDIDRDRDQYILHKEYEVWIGKLNSLHLEGLLKDQQNYQKHPPKQVIMQKPVQKVAYYNNVNNAVLDTNSLIAFLKTMNAKSLDVNNDNTIAYGEMTGYFKKYYQKPISDDVIRKLFCDINNNMNYGNVDLDKFNAWLGRLNSLHLEKILGSAPASGGGGGGNGPKVKYTNTDPNYVHGGGATYNNGNQ